MRWPASSTGCRCPACEPTAATFFVFTDYMRGGMRLASIMHQPVLYILTHDSIGVGEDGPTHQPVEHLAACRAIPGLYVFRPGDANEVAECYRTAMQIDDHPSALGSVATKHADARIATKYAAASGCAKGGYVLVRLRRHARCDSDGQRQRTGPLRHRAAKQLTGRRQESSRRQHALHGSVRASRARRTATKCCRRR